MTNFVAFDGALPTGLFCGVLIFATPNLGNDIVMTPVLGLQKPRVGDVRQGGNFCAKLSLTARQICAKLLHLRKGVQNCRKLVANLKVNFGQFYANAPLAMPPS